jgi:hypothetical protein
LRGVLPQKDDVAISISVFVILTLNVVKGKNLGVGLYVLLPFFLLIIHPSDPLPLSKEGGRIRKRG